MPIDVAVVNSPFAACPAKHQWLSLIHISGIKIGQFVGIEYIVAASLVNLRYNLLDSLLVYR